MCLSLCQRLLAFASTCAAPTAHAQKRLPRKFRPRLRNVDLALTIKDCYIRLRTWPRIEECRERIKVRWRGSRSVDRGSRSVDRGSRSVDRGPRRIDRGSRNVDRVAISMTLGQDKVIEFLSITAFHMVELVHFTTLTSRKTVLQAWFPMDSSACWSRCIGASSLVYAYALGAGRALILRYWHKHRCIFFFNSSLLERCTSMGRGRERRKSGVQGRKFLWTNTFNTFPRH